MGKSLCFSLHLIFSRPPPAELDRSSFLNNGVVFFISIENLTLYKLNLHRVDEGFFDFVKDENAREEDQ